MERSDAFESSDFTLIDSETKISQETKDVMEKSFNTLPLDNGVGSSTESHDIIKTEIENNINQLNATECQEQITTEVAGTLQSDMSDKEITENISEINSNLEKHVIMDTDIKNNISFLGVTECQENLTNEPTETLMSDISILSCLSESEIRPKTFEDISSNVEKLDPINTDIENINLDVTECQDKITTKTTNIYQSDISNLPYWSNSEITSEHIQDNIISNIENHDVVDTDKENNINLLNATECQGKLTTEETRNKNFSNLCLSDRELSLKNIEEDFCNEIKPKNIKNDISSKLDKPDAINTELENIKLLDVTECQENIELETIRISQSDISNIFYLSNKEIESKNVMDNSSFNLEKHEAEISQRNDSTTISPVSDLEKIFKETEGLCSEFCIVKNEFFEESLSIDDYEDGLTNSEYFLNQNSNDISTVIDGLINSQAKIHSDVDDEEIFSNVKDTSLINKELLCGKTNYVGNVNSELNISSDGLGHTNFKISGYTKETSEAQNTSDMNSDMFFKYTSEINEPNFCSDVDCVKSIDCNQQLLPLYIETENKDKDVCDNDDEIKFCGNSDIENNHEGLLTISSTLNWHCSPGSADNSTEKLVERKLAFVSCNDFQSFSSNDMQSESFEKYTSEITEKSANEGLINIELGQTTYESTTDASSNHSLIQKNTTILDNDHTLNEKLKNVQLSTIETNKENLIKFNSFDSFSLLNFTQTCSENMEVNYVNKTPEISLKNEHISNEADINKSILDITANTDISQCRDTDPFQSFCLSQSLHQPKIETNEHVNVNQTTYSNKNINLTLVNCSQSLVNDTDMDKIHTEDTFFQNSAVQKKINCSVSSLSMLEEINIDCVACDRSVLYDTNVNEPTLTEDPLKSFCLDESLNPILLKSHDKIPERELWNQHIKIIDKIHKEYVNLSEILSNSEANCNELIKMNELNDSFDKIVKVMLMKSNEYVDNFLKTDQLEYRDMNITGTDNFEHLIILQEDNRILANKVTDLENQLKRSENENKKLVNKIKEIESLEKITTFPKDKTLLQKINLLENQLKQTNSYKEENAFLFDKVKDLELQLDAFPSLQDENKILKQQLIDLHQKLKESEILEDELEISFQIIENQNFQLSDEIKKCELQLNEFVAAKEDNIILDNKEEKLQLEVQLLREECEYLFSKIKEFEITMSRFVFVQTENEFLLQRVKELEEQLFVGKTIDACINLVENVKYDMPKDYLEDSNISVLSVEKDTDSLKLKSTIKGELESHIDKATKKELLNILEEESTYLEEKQKIELEQRIESLTVKENENNKQLKELNIILAENNELKKKIQEFQRSIEKLTAVKIENLNLVEQLRELKLVNTDNLLLRESINELEQIIKNLTFKENKNTDKLKELESVNVDNIMFKERINQCEQIIESLTIKENENIEQLKNLEFIMAENNMLMEKFQEFESTIEKLTIVENENLHLVEQLRELESINADNILLKEKINQFEQIIESLSVKENKNIEQLKKLEFIMAENTILKQNIEEFERATDKLIIIEKENLHLVEQLRELESVNADNNLLKEKINEFEQIVESMTIKENKNFEQLKCLESITVENTMLKQDIKEFEKTTEQLTQMENENLHLCKQLQELESVNTDNILLQERISEFEQIIKSMTVKENKNVEQLKNLEFIMTENNVLKEKIQEYERTIEKLTIVENENLHLVEQLRRLESVNADNILLNEKINEFEQVINNLTVKENKNNEQLKELESVHADNMLLNEKINEFEQIVERMTIKENKNFEQLKCLESITVENTMLKQDIKEFEKTTEQLTQMENENLHLCTQLQELESVNTDNILLQERISEFEQIIESMTVKENKNVEQLKNLEFIMTENNVLKEKIQEYERTIEKLTVVENENLHLVEQLRRLESVNADNILLNEKINEFEQVINNLTVKENKNNEQLKELESVHADNMFLNEKINEFEQIVESMTIKENKNFEQLKCLESITVENTMLKQDIKEFEKTTEQLTQMENENLHLCKQLQELESVNTDNILLQERISEFEQIIKSMTVKENKNVEQLKNLEFIMTENNVLKEKIQEYERTIEKLTIVENENLHLVEQLRRLESVNADNILLNEKINEFEQVINNLTVKENKNNEQLKELESVHADNMLLNEKINEFEQWINNMTIKENKNNEQLKELESVHADNMLLNEKINEFEQLINNLTVKENKNNEQLKELESVHADNMLLNEKINEFEQIVESMTIKENKNFEQLKCLESITEENTMLKQYIKELEKTIEKLTQIENDNWRLCKQLQELEAENILLNEKINEFEQIIENMTVKENKNIEQLKNLEFIMTENNILKEKIQEFERTIEKLTIVENENLHLVEQLRELESLNADNILLNKKIIEFEQVISNLTVKENKNNKQLKELESVHADNMLLRKKVEELGQIIENMIDKENKNNEQLKELVSINRDNIMLKEKINEFEQIIESVTIKENKNFEQLKNLEFITAENLLLKQKVQEFENTEGKLLLMEKENLRLVEQTKELESVNVENALFKKKLQVYENDNNNLTRQLEYFKNEKLDLRGIVDEIEATVEEKVQENELLQEKNKVLNNKVQALESELGSINVSKISVMQENALLLDKMSKFEEIEEKLNFIISGKIKGVENSEVESLKEKLLKYDELIENLTINKSEKSALLEKEMESVNLKNISLTKKIEELEQIIEKSSVKEKENLVLSEKLISINAENTTLKHNLQEFEKAIENLTMLENEKLKLSEKIIHFDTINNENMLLKQKLEEFEGHKCSSEIVEGNIIITNKKQIISEMEAEQCMCNDKINNLKEMIIQEIVSLNPRVETEDLVRKETTFLFKKLLEVFVEKEQELVLAIQNNFQNQLQCTQKNYKELQNYEDCLKTNLEEYKLENEKLSKEIDNLKSQLKIVDECHLKEKENELKKNEKELKFQLEDHQRKLLEINNLVIEKDSLITILNNQITDLTKNNLLLSETVTLEKNKSDELSQTITKLDESVKSQEITLNRLSDEIQEKDIEIVNMKAMIASTEKDRKIHESMVEEIIRNLKSETLLISEECKQLCDHLGNNPFGLRSTLNNIKNNFIVLKSVIDLFIQKITEEDVEYKNQIEVLKNTVREKDLLCSELNLKSIKINEELCLSKESENKLLAKLENTEVELKAVSSELKRQSEEHLCLVDKLNKTEILCNQLKEEVDKVNEYNKELQAKDMEFRTVVSELKMKVEECSQLSLKVKENQEYLEKASTEISTYSVESVKMSKEIENLNALYKMEKQQNKNLLLKIEFLTVKNNDLSSRNVVLEGELNCAPQNENHKILKKIESIVETKLSNADDVYNMVSGQVSTIKTLQKTLNELKLENNNLISEHSMMKKCVKQKEIEYGRIIDRENKLKDKYENLLVKFNTTKNASIGKHAEPVCSLHEIEKTLVDLFPGTPLNISGALQRIKEMSEEVNTLKKKLFDLEEEKNYIDKECDTMFKMIKYKEKEIGEILQRENTTVNELKTQLEETKKIMDKQLSLKTVEKEFKLPNSKLFEDLKEKHEVEKEKLTSEIKSMCKESEKYREERDSLSCQLTGLQKQLSEKSANICECEQLKSQINEMKVAVADRNAKITSLELQIESEINSYKKQNKELEHLLEQSKHKIKDLKSDVRRYQIQAHEASVFECQKCRRRNEHQVHTTVQTEETLNPKSCVEAHGMKMVEEQLRKANKEIYLLKQLCRERNAKINELQGRTPQPRRSVLKENNMPFEESNADGSSKPPK